MRIIWTLLKMIVALCVAIPLAIIGLGLTVGILGAMLGMAILALKLAFVGFLAFGAYRLVRGMFGIQAKPKSPVVRQLSEPRDPYYESAMRELDLEFGGTRK